MNIFQIPQNSSEYVGYNPFSDFENASSKSGKQGVYENIISVGNNFIEIRGDCLGLVQEAKVALNYYFGTGNKMAEYSNNISDDNSSVFTSCDQTQISLSTSYESPSSNLTSSLGEMTSLIPSNSYNSAFSGCDAVDRGSTLAPYNLVRIRRSHFSLSDSNLVQDNVKNDGRYSYDKNRLIFLQKSPYSVLLPREWNSICVKLPGVIRSQFLDDSNNNNTAVY